MNKVIWFAALVSTVASMPTLGGGNPQAGKEKAAACAGCHGADGNAEIGANPRLAGQYESYLLQALQQYKSGQRQDLLMSNMVSGLSTQDMKDLAAWFSSQQGQVLQVLPGERHR